MAVNMFEQYGIKEGILKLDIVHKVCNLFPKNIKIKTKFSNK